MLSSLSWASAGFAKHVWGQAWPVCMRELFCMVSSFWFHWFSQADHFFHSLLFAAAWASLSSSLQVISIRFDSFPHQLGISALALDDATNCACLWVSRYDTIVESCKRSRDTALCRSGEAWMPSRKPENLNQGQAFGAPVMFMLFAKWEAGNKMNMSVAMLWTQLKNSMLNRGGMGCFPLVIMR